MANHQLHPGNVEIRGASARIRFSIRGKRHYVTIGTTDPVEIARVARREYDRLAGRARRSESLVPPTFSELMADYRHRGMRTLSAGSVECYEKSLAVFERFFVRERRDPRVDRIGRRMIEDFLDWRGDQVGAHTVKRDYSVLRLLFSFAVESEYVESVPKVKPPKAEARAYVLLRSDEDLDRLLEACGPRRMLRLFVLTGIETGARGESEILHLQWRDVDFASRTITFASGRDGHRLKGGASKVLPMSRRLENALREHAATFRLSLGSPYVFAHPTTRGQHRRGERIKSLRSSFKAAAKRAGFEGMRPHDLRHSCATILLSRGAPISKVQRFLGHASVQMTQGYEHLVPEDLRDLVDDERRPHVHAQRVS